MFFFGHPVDFNLLCQAQTVDNGRGVGEKIERIQFRKIAKRRFFIQPNFNKTKFKFFSLFYFHVL